MADEEARRRLDLIQATLQLAFRPQLDAARQAVRGEAVNAAILDLTDAWEASKTHPDTVAAKTKKSARTVRDRLPELVEQRIRDARGRERRMEYRRTGLS